MSHISYNPFLALSIFILIYLLFFKNLDKHIISKIISTFFLLTMTINVFITGGRAGQIGFFVMLGLAFIFYFKKNIKISILLILFVLPTIFYLAYNTSNIFNNRVNEAKSNLLQLEENRNTSVGRRITFAQNSLRIIKDNLLFGVGTGDFKLEYEKINQEHTPELETPDQPHNMYLLVLSQNWYFWFNVYAVDILSAI